MVIDVLWMWNIDGMVIYFPGMWNINRMATDVLGMWIIDGMVIYFQGMWNINGMVMYFLGVWNIDGMVMSLNNNELVIYSGLVSFQILMEHL